MNIDPKAEICDSNRSILQHSAISHSSIEFQMNNQNGDDQISVMDTNELSKKMLKLELNQRNDAEKGSIDLEDEKEAKLPDIKSPKSPLSNSSKCPKHISILQLVFYHLTSMPACNCRMVLYIGVQEILRCVHLCRQGDKTYWALVEQHSFI